MSPARPSPRLTVVLVAVALLAGCVGSPAGEGPTIDDATTAGTTQATAATSSAPATDTSSAPTTATSSASATDTASTTAPPIPAVSDRSAVERAIAAEERRVEAVLANASNLSGSTGVMTRPGGEVTARTAGGVRVRVTTSYSYEYHCDGRAGAVDGLETTAVYRVTEDATLLVRVVTGVRNVCES